MARPFESYAALVARLTGAFRSDFVGIASTRSVKNPCRFALNLFADVKIQPIVSLAIGAAETSEANFISGSALSRSGPDSADDRVLDRLHRGERVVLDVSDGL